MSGTLKRYSYVEQLQSAFGDVAISIKIAELLLQYSEDVKNRFDRIT